MRIDYEHFGLRGMAGAQLRELGGGSHEKTINTRAVTISTDDP
jgi:hypothetical protein